MLPVGVTAQSATTSIVEGSTPLVPPKQVKLTPPPHAVSGGPIQPSTQEQVDQGVAKLSPELVPPSEEVLKIRAVENSVFGEVKFKSVGQLFERRGRQFISGDPEMLFIAEYVVSGRLVGAIVAWEQFIRDGFGRATHYEVFKKNLFQSGAKFERILFLDDVSLTEERRYFERYLTNVLGMKGLDMSKLRLVLDTRVKEDRIYEYKVKASRIPESAIQVDYDLILEGKDLLHFSSATPAQKSRRSKTIFEKAKVVYGSKDLAWGMALVNEGESYNFFGQSAQEATIAEISVPDPESPNQLIDYWPKNFNDILCIMKESISLFGVKDTFAYLLSVLGGLSRPFTRLALDSIDEDAGTFSYDYFKDEVKKISPIFNLAVDIFESIDNVFVGLAVGADTRTGILRTQLADELDELSGLSIVIPPDEGSDAIGELVGLSSILRFINETFLAVMNSQDDFSALKDIAERVQKAKERAGEDTVDEAVREDRDEVAGDPGAVLGGDLYAVEAGLPVDVVASDSAGGVVAVPSNAPPSADQTASSVLTVDRSSEVQSSTLKVVKRGFTIL